MKNTLDPKIDELIHSLEGMTDEELQHWGIKGMRWGQRRYQNKDGSLTPAGRKRYTNPDGSLNEKGKKYIAKEKERLEAEKKTIARQKRTNSAFDQLDKMREKNESLKNGKPKKSEDVDDDEPQTPNKKSASELTDKELQDKVNRLRNEDAYKDLSKKLGYDDGPKTELDFKIAEMEKQKKYLELQRDIKNLTPQKVSRGKKILDTVMNKVVEPAATEAGKRLLSKYLNGAVDNLFDKQTKKAVSNVGNTLKDTAKTTKDATEKAVEQERQKQAKKQAKQQAKAEKKAAKKAEKYSEAFEGTVEGVGTSSRKTTSSKSRSSDVIDAEWWSPVSNTKVTSMTTSDVSRGRSYVSDYLGLPAPKDDD